MSIVSILFEQKRWLPQDILSYIVTGVPDGPGTARVYNYDTDTDELKRAYDDNTNRPLTLAYGTLLEVSTERGRYKYGNDGYRWYREILKCPDYPMAVGDLVLEDHITKVN